MAKRKIPAKKIEDVARLMGFENLRTGQKEAIQAVTSGQDTLVIMPTGAGKSAIYHIAGILIDGPTVVISPLLALQQDQIGSIEDKDVAPAAALNSRQRQKNRRDAFRALAHGDLESIFLAPEQFNNEDVLKRHEAQIARIEIMRNYAETHECRRGFILHYFGESYQAPCDYCDRCESRDRNTQQEQTSLPFPVKSWVIHTQWGKGVVEKYEGDKITVLFSSDAGRRSLSLTTVLENKLLTAA